MSPLVFPQIAMKSKEAIIELLMPILEEHDLFLVEVMVSSENVIQVYVDSLTGTNISTCIAVSKALEEQLDREEEDFELTVSSAGIGTVLKVPKQYEKNLGKAVEVRLSDGKKMEGVLKSYTSEGIVIAYEEKIVPEGKKKKETVVKEKEIPFNEIKEVRDIVIF